MNQWPMHARELACAPACDLWARPLSTMAGSMPHLRGSSTLVWLSSLLQAVPQDWNGFAYVYEGSGQIGGKGVQIEHAYVLANEGDEVRPLWLMGVHVAGAVCGCSCAAALLQQSCSALRAAQGLLRAAVHALCLQRRPPCMPATTRQPAYHARTRCMALHAGPSHPWKHSTNLLAPRTLNLCNVL